MEDRLGMGITIGFAVSAFVIGGASWLICHVREGMWEAQVDYLDAQLRKVIRDNSALRLAAKAASATEDAKKVCDLVIKSMNVGEEQDADGPIRVLPEVKNGQAAK